MGGRTDRFDWKLVGKQEMYVPYNTNKVQNAAQPQDLLGKHHLNPDYVRWELHRVWVLESTVAAGKRHLSCPRAVTTSMKTPGKRCSAIVGMPAANWPKPSGRCRRYCPTCRGWCSSLQVFMT